MKSVKASPKASALIESLRDIGYSPQSAAADIVDNSITAGCKDIGIWFDWNEQESTIAFIDNGCGMSESELIEAMRPGCINPLNDRDKSDLGRFGLGLKTGSFSQCRKLTVASRKKNNELFCCRWDLDFVAEKDDWLLQILEKKDIQLLPHIDKLGNCGTLVLWEQPDRVIDCTDKSITEDDLYEKMDAVRKHLELVFHRYLKGERGLRKISISINNDKLEPFDPFNSKHPATQRLTEEKLSLYGETVRIQPYILPHHSKIGRKEYEYYGGEAGYLKTQGFYVYRNARLLISGTWFRLVKQSELTKLARVKIDLPNSLDHLWSIDVKKSMAVPPAAVKTRLKNIIDRILGSSSKVYTKRGRKLTKKDIVAVWNRYAGKSEIFYTVNREHPFILDLQNSLDENGRTKLNNALTLLESRFPVDAFYADVSNNPEELTQDKIEEDKILALAEIMLGALLREKKMDSAGIIKTFSVTDPFRNHELLCSKFLQSKGIV